MIIIMTFFGTEQSVQPEQFLLIHEVVIRFGFWFVAIFVSFREKACGQFAHFLVFR